MRSDRLPLLLSLLPLLPLSLPAQVAPDAGTIVIAASREATSPIPTLWANDQVNREVSDLMFLRLVEPAPSLRTADEKSFVPKLARHWARRDSLTLVFDLDPRARWQDGTPVTSRDAVFTLERARDPVLSPQTASLLRRISGVTAEGDGRVVVHFREAYAEQLYDATYHAPLLPAHLLQGIPPESLATSAFARSPVGSGPYRFGQRTPGARLELTGWDAFYLGRPRIRRVIFLLAADPEARVNLVLNGTVDVLESIYAMPNPARLEHLPAFLYYPVPGLQLSYITMNLRNPADTSQPHPLLADADLRRALVLLLDRRKIARGAYGPMTGVPNGPVSSIVGRTLDIPEPAGPDPGKARRLLAARGWADHDGDGVLDREGTRLSLSLLVPSVVFPRRLMATQIQEAYRLAGIELRLEVLEPQVFTARRRAGTYDLEFTGVTQDPTPSGLTQTWLCSSPRISNVNHFCDPVVDSLVARGLADRSGGARPYREAMLRIAEDVPAIFMTSTTPMVAVHRRITNVSIRPESTWLELWRWSVRPGQQLERDRQ